MTPEREAEIRALLAKMELVNGPPGECSWRFEASELLAALDHERAQHADTARVALVENDRAVTAEAALVALRERVQFMLDRENPDSYPKLRAALASTALILDSMKGSGR